jgi:hypothetical protein
MTLEELQNEVVASLNKHGPAATVDLCLPMQANYINTPCGRVPARYYDPIRDQYLARALTVHVLGDWIASWRRVLPI